MVEKAEAVYSLSAREIRVAQSLDKKKVTLLIRTPPTADLGGLVLGVNVGPSGAREIAASLIKFANKAEGAQ